MGKKNSYILMALLVFSASAYAKVLICTFAYNKPGFIELQHKTFTKFLHDPYEFVVFNDAQDADIFNQIKAVCSRCNITCISIPQEIHDRPYLDRPNTSDWWLCDYHCPSARNCNVVQYALDAVGFDHNDIVVLFESDIFLIKDFSFKQYLQNEIAGYDRSVEYKGNREKMPFLWIGLIFVNMPALPQKNALNVNCGYIQDTIMDSGGHTHFQITSIPSVKVQYFDKKRIEQFICTGCKINKRYQCTHNSQELEALGFNERTIKFIQQVPIDWGSGLPGRALIKRNLEFFLDNTFVHFYGGSEYAMMGNNQVSLEKFYRDKAAAFYDFINEIV